MSHIETCKTVVNHLLSENANLRKKINTLENQNKLLETNTSIRLSNLDDSWKREMKQMKEYTKNLEKIIVSITTKEEYSPDLKQIINELKEEIY